MRTMHGCIQYERSLGSALPRRAANRRSQCLTHESNRRDANDDGQKNEAGEGLRRQRRHRGRRGGPTTANGRREKEAPHALGKVEETMGTTAANNPQLGTSHSTTTARGCLRKFLHPSGGVTLGGGDNLASSTHGGTRTRVPISGAAA